MTSADLRSVSYDESFRTERPPFLGLLEREVLRFLNNLTKAGPLDIATLERWLLLAQDIPGITLTGWLSPGAVRDHMTHILRRLNDVRFMEFTDMFMERLEEGAAVAVVVVHFIAMLELARESLLEITQAEPYAPIYVRLAYTRVAAAA